MSYLKELVSATKNKLATIASEGVYTDDIIFTDTGSYILNAMLSGSLFKGIPGRVTMFAGPPSTGKTFLLLSIAKNFIDTGKEVGEDRVVIYFESEGAINTEMLQARDFDLEKISIVPVGTLEQFRTQCIQVIEAYRNLKDNLKILLCLDSYGMLSSEKELEDTAEGKNTRDMTKSQVGKGIFRVLTLKLAELGLGLLVTNHVYAAVGCLEEHTKVLMSDETLKQIKDIHIGDFVRTATGNKRVNEVFHYEINDYIEFTLENNIVIKCTPEHKFLTTNLEWKKASDIDEEDEIVIN